MGEGKNGSRERRGWDGGGEKGGEVITQDATILPNFAKLKENFNLKFNLILD